jgi:hypothetical protein
MRLSLGLDDIDDDEGGRNASTHPERLRQQRPSRRPKMRARRSRSNEMAKRGIHQRRNKRRTW